jgi:DNA-binding transcriptional regulator YiaG
MEATVDQLKKLREWQSLSQEGLARLLGVSVRTVVRWENGQSKPSPLANQKLEAIVLGRFEGGSDGTRS